MKMRLLVSWLVLIIVFTLLAGCSTGNKDIANQNADKVTREEQPDTDNKEKEEEIPTIYIFQNIGKIQSAGKPGSNPEDLEEVRQYILDKTGIRVEVIIPPKGAIEQKLNTMLASQEPIDLFWGSWTNYVVNGAIQPLNDILDKFGADIKRVIPEEDWAGVTDKEGNIWGIPRNSPRAVYPVYVRMDWLEKLGLQMPNTIDELENVLKAFKENDPAGNGETIPLASDLTGLNRCLAAGFMGVGYGNWLDSDGKIKPPELHPGYKDFVKKMAEWYKKGYIFKEAFVTNRDRYTELLKMNRIGALAYWYSLTTIQSPYLTQNVPEAKYDFNKNGIQGPKGLCETIDGVSPQAGLIPRYSKNAEYVIKYLDWAFSDVENHIICENGIKGKHWEYVDEQSHTVRLISENYIGEFVATQGLPMETQYRFNDPIKAMHYEYLNNYILDLDRGVRTADWDIVYDMKKINDEVPTLGDINRLRTEEITKFIMGARPIEEYDKFIEELYQAGLDKWIEAYTAQYNELKK